MKPVHFLIPIVLIKNIFFHQSMSYDNRLQNFNSCVKSGFQIEVAIKFSIQSSIHRILINQMRAIDGFKNVKHFPDSVRPSQSLHCRFLKNNFGNQSKKTQPRKVDEITICIIYKKKKIQFSVKSKTPFDQLNQELYRRLHNYLLIEAQISSEKIQKIMKSVVGFESVDGDINFDYRLSLEKGCVEKTKFFHPFAQKSTQSNTIKYKIYNCLAIGGFSKVYLARSYENGQFYAIKFIRKYDRNDLHEKDKFQSLKNEIQVSQELDHPFLVKLLQAFETTDFYCMVFQYCPGGELFYLLKKVKLMSEEMAKFYFLQILYGIQYLHSKSIIYRDLKPQNILIDADGNCKIVDFGLSKKIDARSKTFSYCGSAEYMAPEMILRTGHSFGIDYYSLGALLYELVTGLPPYYTKNHDQLQESIICKQITFPQHIQLSNEIKDLLERLLKKDQKYRLGSYIGIKEIIFHPWIGKIKSNSILSKEMHVPFAPNLEDYNFDTSQLGDDEEEYTALVHENINQQNRKESFYKQFYKSQTLINFQRPFITELLAQTKSVSKENHELTRIQSIKRNLSKEKLKEIVRSHNVLERIQQNSSKEKLLRGNITVQERRAKDIYKLYPYLNCQKSSPMKQKELMNFIEQRIIKIDRSENSKKLKRIRIQKNRIDNQQVN